MIPLTDFAYRRVLDGARVPIADVRSCPDRLEWLCDRLLTQLPDGKWWTADVDWHVRYLALDPTDPDVARLIDRRIAEAFGYTAVHIAIFDARGGQWVLNVYSTQPPTHRSIPAPFDIEAVDANIPLARAALLCALYPPEIP